MWKITRRTLLAVCLSLIFLSSVAIAQIAVRPIGTYASGLFDESAAEIVAHDPNTQRLYVVNANSGNIDVLDINNPATPTPLFQIDTAPYGDGANSVAVHNGIVVVAVQADPEQAPGAAIFFTKIFCVETSCFSPGRKRSFLLSIYVLIFSSILCYNS